MSSVLKLIFAGVAALAMFGESTGAQTAPRVNVGPPLNVADLDRSVAACTDFYHFANGGWLKANPIPPQYSTWGSFTELTERNNVLLREVLESAARQAKKTKDADTRKVGTFYASCTDSAAAEAAGVKPLAGEIARIAAISNRAQLVEQIAHMHSIGLGPLFGFGSDQEAKNSSLVTDRVLGEALGREYVKVAFTPAAKAKALEMADNLRAVMRQRIEHADWMSENTRRQALVKLASFNRKIGYPDKWRDYSALRVEAGPYATNILYARMFGAQRNLAKIGKPVDRGEWFMTAPTVNAYYSPQLNEVVFPAGRLQAPFFHPTYDEGANYGGIGGTIGHEMSHGFDDQGRQFDAQGNLRDWWTAEDAKRYTERATVVEKQYDAYTVLDTVHVNGKLTLGENLADVVGVSVAFDALELALAGKPRPLIDGFTPEQRFFLAYAQARRANVRPEQARLAIQTDPHSPGEYRVNGPLANMPQFAKAFDCKTGDTMVRPDSLRANIW